MLDEPRRPWLEPQALKRKFLALSAAVHPDRAHQLDAAQRSAAQSRYTELNAAYTRLREPKDRLRHLIELERGRAPKDIQQIPGDLMEWFMETGQLCRQADSLIQEKNRLTSPLLKVQFLERAQEWIEKLAALQTRLDAHRSALVGELKALDEQWMFGSNGDRTRAELIDRLERLSLSFAYFDRWIAHVHERIVQLSL